MKRLLELAAFVGKHVGAALVTLDLRKYGVTDEAPLDVAVFVFHDDGLTFESAFQTTLEGEDKLAAAVEQWLANRGKHDAPRVM